MGFAFMVWLAGEIMVFYGMAPWIQGFWMGTCAFIAYRMEGDKKTRDTIYDSEEWKSIARRKEEIRLLSFQKNERAHELMEKWAEPKSGNKNISPEIEQQRIELWDEAQVLYAEIDELWKEYRVLCEEEKNVTSRKEK